jgi:Stress responsive A/B Barrel Domain
MILHVVLFRPRPDLTEIERDALIASIDAVAHGVPSISRVRVGRRLSDPPIYVQGGFPDFPFFACLEFENRGALEAYLAHPLHVDLGRRFNATLEATLIYDVEVSDVAETSGAAAVLLGR